MVSFSRKIECNVGILIPVKFGNKNAIPLMIGIRNERVHFALSNRSVVN